jgi:hypothetical protein
VKEHNNPQCQSKYVCIEPGTAIDCCGHEILIREEECIDITQLEAWKTINKQEEGKKEPTPHSLQICMRYRECPTEDVPVLFDECGCDETKCAPNRILESYDIDLIIDPKPIEGHQEECKDIPWRHLEGCPHCDKPDCIVLATIYNYRLNDRMLNMPADEQHDAENKIARIDNTSRRLLPSTQTLYDMIQCVMDGSPGQGGGGGEGPRGKGIDKVVVEQIPCGQVPGETKIVEDPKGERTLTFQVNKGCDAKIIPIELPRIVAINWPHNGVVKLNTLDKDGLVIAFQGDRPVLAETLNTQSVQLLFQRIESDSKEGFDIQCYCNVRGQVTGVKVEANCDKGILEIRGDITSGPVTGARFRPLRAEKPGKFLAGEYRVVLEGDFILGEKMIDIPNPNDPSKTISVHPALDANHLGPGLLGPGKGRCPTGDGIEGGRFVSWFSIK